MQKSDVTLIPTNITDSADSSSVLVSLISSMKSCLNAVSVAGQTHDISPEEWLILEALQEKDGLTGLTMSEFRKNSIGGASSLTRAVDRLVSRALVFREIGQQDRRQILVHISALGRSVHADMNHDIQKLERDIKEQFLAKGIDPQKLTHVLGEIFTK